jgi:hypothetical protein
MIAVLLNLDMPAIFMYSDWLDDRLKLQLALSPVGGELLSIF